MVKQNQHPLTPSFPMEKKFDYECETIEEVIYLNNLSFEIQEIFTKEKSLPNYYEQKNFKHGLDKLLVFTSI